MKKLNAVAVMALSGIMAMPAFAEGEVSPIDQLFASVSLTSVTVFVAATGATIIGIALAVKGISLAKRVINKA